MELLNPLTVYRGDLRYLRFNRDVACLSSDAVGELMCVRGDRVNGKLRVQKADITDLSKMPAIGILISKSTPTVGVIQWIGECDILTGLDWTKPGLWVGRDSLVTSTRPTANVGETLYLQRFGKAIASDIFLIDGNLNLYVEHG